MPQEGNMVACVDYATIPYLITLIFWSTSFLLLLSFLFCLLSFTGLCTPTTFTSLMQFVFEEVVGAVYQHICLRASSTGASSADGNDCLFTTSKALSNICLMVSECHFCKWVQCLLAPALHSCSNFHLGGGNQQYKYRQKSFFCVLIYFWCFLWVYLRLHWRKKRFIWEERRCVQLWRVLAF